jgi:hypothetical protein
VEETELFCISGSPDLSNELRVWSELPVEVSDVGVFAAHRNVSLRQEDTKTNNNTNVKVRPKGFLSAPHFKQRVLVAKHHTVPHVIIREALRKKSCASPAV